MTRDNIIDDTQMPFPISSASFCLGSLVQQRAEQAEELLRRIVYAEDAERGHEIRAAARWLRQFGSTEQAILGS